MTKVDSYPPSLSQVNDYGAHRPGVIARLHALFPSSPTTTQDPAPPLPPKSMSTKAIPPPKSIKARILTWNMHDSLPKGELDELLGKVQPSTPSYSVSDGETLPDFPLDENHPYHLVVVSGQECPTISGLPRGLGAPGFQLRERDREKARQKEKEKDEHGEHAFLLQSKSEGGVEREPEGRERERERPRSLHRLHLHREHSQKGQSDNLSVSNSGASYEHHATYGWSSMLEDWYTQAHSPQFRTGSSDVLDDGNAAPSMLDVPIGDERDNRQDDAVFSPKAQSTGDLNARINAVASSRGPYELLVKERMMGLYIAVFVHRDVRPLVRGTSKSAVTAGLIGGRLGNKGAVGVSLNLAGATMLFINAHLAAHEGKMHHRLSNLAKIKSELAVNDFLSPDDPRVMSEDLTDRFDFSFICGDLNFRLDITRLHADWLLSRKEYAQALAFDQLRKVMEGGEGFVGFHEAPIDFPPTFKYDVHRSKRSKHRSLKRLSRAPSAADTTQEKTLAEIEEKDREEEREDEEIEEEAEAEAASLASSAWTSAHSRYTNGDMSEQEKELLDRNEEYFSYTDPSTAAATRANSQARIALHKVWANAAAHKAKAKFISLLSSSPGSPAGKLIKLKKKADQQSDDICGPPSTATSPTFRASTFPPTPSQSVPTTPGPEDDRFLKPSRSLASNAGDIAKAVVRAGSPKSRKSSESSESLSEDEKGVYDSSNKKRVPSWCDRILWKSNVVPEPEPEEEEESPLPPQRTRVSNFFHALRPSSLRSRKDSQFSIRSTISTDASDTEDEHEHKPSPRGHLPSSPLSRQPQSRPRPIRNSRSTDALPRVERPQLDRFPTQHASPVENKIQSRKSLPAFSVISSDSSMNSTAVSSSPPQLPLPDFSSNTTDSPPPVPLKDQPQPLSSIWRNFSFFPSFLTRDAATLGHERPSETPPELPPPPPQPKRGDVVCLGYHTLDDKAMKRLMGKSDHRPVIGSYAMYI